MIIVRLHGGLGNQMFQYALGRKLSLFKNVGMLLDLSWFDMQTERQYQLNSFNIQSEIATKDDIEKILQTRKQRIIKKIEKKTGHKFLRRFSSIYIEDNSSKFDKKVFYCPKNILIKGYWQSEKYFYDIKDQLVQDFILRNGLSPNAQMISTQMLSDPNSVSVHIRRGDYVDNSFGHYLLPIDYYQRAINLLLEKHVIPSLFVFSDDIEWARKNFDFYPVTTFLDSSKYLGDAEELILMTHCHHHVNANSSFSWWGAWLQEKADSIITVPDQWFTEKDFPQDRVPNRWYRL